MDLGEQLLCPPSPAISKLFRSRTVRGYGTSHAYTHTCLHTHTHSHRERETKVEVNSINLLSFSIIYNHDIMA